MSKDLRIAFFSSSDFVLPILESIVAAQSHTLYLAVSNQINKLNTESAGTLSYPSIAKLQVLINKYQDILQNYSIKLPLIITQPDRINRNKTIKTPLSLFAENNGLELYQPQRIKNELASFIQTIEHSFCKIGLVASYGQILPQEALDVFKYGIINWHPSLLPKYRGPTPMQSVIYNGDTSSGLSWITMDAGMDSGPLLAQLTTQIEPQYTTQTIASMSGTLGTNTWAIAVALRILSQETSENIEYNQDEFHATFTTMLSKEFKHINLDQISARGLINHFRAYVIFPGTTVFLAYFNSEVRIDDLDWYPVDSLQEVLHYEDIQLAVTVSGTWYLKTQDSFVQIKVITILTSGKQINLGKHTIKSS